MPSTRVVFGAAVGCMFVCGLFAGQGMAQTSSTIGVGELIKFLHPGKSETKPKHSSKPRPAPKKLASTKSSSNEAQEVTASELVVDGGVIRAASPNAANNVDIAANVQGTPERSDAPPAAATVVNAVSLETMPPADKSNSGAAHLSQTPSGSIGSMPWLLRVIAALSGAMATGLLAWFLIKPSASGEVWARLSEP